MTQLNKGVNLLANLDEHSDWVNKVIHIESANTLLSCSNDTTIRVWRLKSNEDYIKRNQYLYEKKQGRQTYRQQSISVLHNHTDYVRTMDYSVNLGSLFSASDDGKIFLWDLNVAKIMQKYSNFDETGSLSGQVIDKKQKRSKGVEDEQITYATDLKIKNSCPTAMATSASGNYCFVSYTDDSLHLIDVRQPAAE